MSLPVKNIVVGWDLDSIGDQKKTFEAGFTAVFARASGRDNKFYTDPDHISFVSDKEDIDHLVESGKCDIVVCSETLSGDEGIGFGTIKQWKNGGVQKVILILDNSKYAKGKVKSLWENGFYDMLFERDFTGKGLLALILGGRNREQAFGYYGLENYRDLFTENEEESGKGNGSGKTADKGNKGKNNKGSGESTTERADTPPKNVAKDKPLKRKELKKLQAMENGGTSEKADKTDKKKQEQEKDKKRKDKPLDKQDIKEAPQSKGGQKRKEDRSDREDKLDISALEDGSTLSSMGDIIKRQKAIGRSMYGIKRAKDADFSQDLTAFLKPGVNPEDYIKAMEVATHTDVSGNESALNQKDAVLEELLTYYTTQDNTWISNLMRHLSDRAQWDAELRQRISMFGLTGGLSEGVQEEIFKEFNDFMFGYDFLGDLIRDPLVTDIRVFAYDSILVKKKGKRVPYDKTFRTPEHYTAFITHLTKRNHVDIQNNAAVKFMDTKSFEEARLRVNIQTEYINCSGVPHMHIRKENNKKYTTEELVSAGMMDYRTAAYLIYKAREDTGILFVGGNAQGKTSLFNWLLDFLPYTATGQVLQESDELFSHTHKYLQFLQVTDDEEQNFEGGQGVYDLRRLSAIGLKTDNDYFMIGEITGAEAKYFINYVFTGSRCWATVHGMDARAGLPKIVDYGMYDTDYTADQLLEKLTALRVIVYIENFQIKEIIEVAGWDDVNKSIIYKQVPIVVPEKPTDEEDSGSSKKAAG